MSASDGSFDATVEGVEATIDTTGLSAGQHIVFVRGQDAAGNWGAFSAVFLYVSAPSPVPAVNIVSPAEGSTVAGTVPVQIDATDDVDPAGTLTVEWNVDGGAWQPATYNGGTGYYEATWDTTTVGDGAHTVNAQATDSDTNVGSDSNNVTVDNEPDPTVHVGDLDGSSAPAPRNRWDATVTITVHDSNEGAVSGALVEGVWSDGATGGASCTTDASGQCSVSKTDLKSNVPSVTFSVSNVTSGVGRLCRRRQPRSRTATATARPSSSASSRSAEYTCQRSRLTRQPVDPQRPEEPILWPLLVPCERVSSLWSTLSGPLPTPKSLLC